jgi:T5SS/PEP-CTERM-associated repeat protein/autotransporter-associated beta strand protein
VLVQGANSTWTNTNDVVVGQAGDGTLEVRGGGKLYSLRGHVGFNTNSSGSVIVSDPGSKWTATGSFFIGNGGVGSLQVLNGAVASTAGNSYLGFSTTALGTATVSGAGSTWNTAAGLYIGGNAAAPGGAFGSTLSIEDGGAVNAGSITLYGTGTLELYNATTLTGPLTSLGGLIRTFGNTALANDITLGSGGLFVVNFTNNATSTFSGTMSGTGGLTKSGLGAAATLRLTGNCTYTGSTIVNSGTLLLAQGAAGAALAANATVNGGALNVDGATPLTLAGTLTVNAGAKASFNAGAARLTHRVNGLAINGTGTLDINNHELLISNTAPATIKAYLARAYDAAGNQDWARPGLTSSIAASNPTQFSLGYAFGGDPSAQDAGITTHAGAPLAPAQTITRVVLAGDANLDGTVDFFDIAQMLGYRYNTNQPASYTDGDLNYDGKVDFFDLTVILSGNYNTGQHFGPSIEAASPFAAGEIAAVPEPAALGLLGIAATSLLVQRRRRPRRRAPSSPPAAAPASSPPAGTARPDTPTTRC